MKNENRPPVFKEKILPETVFRAGFCLDIRTERKSGFAAQKVPQVHPTGRSRNRFFKSRSEITVEIVQPIGHENQRARGEAGWKNR